MNLPLLRDDFDTTDHNRNVWYGSVIPKVIFILSFIAIIGLFVYLDWYQNTISLVIGGIAAMLVAVSIKNSIRKKLPDFVRPEDIVGEFVIANGRIEVNRSSQPPFSIQKDQIEKIRWKHNFSKEFRFGVKDDSHNGLSIIELFLASQTTITVKIEIQSTYDLLALFDYFKALPDIKTTPRLDRWTVEKLRNSLE